MPLREGHVSSGRGRADVVGSRPQDAPRRRRCRRGGRAHRSNALNESGRGRGSPHDQALDVAGLRAQLVRKGDQNHEFKYAGSILAESRRGDARWRTGYLAVGVDDLPGENAPETDLARRSRRALEKAGVLG